MKTHTLFIIFILLSAFMNINKAQPVVKDAITVNGLKVGMNYTQTQFKSALGTPTRTKGPTSEDEYADAYTFYFGRDYFELFGGMFHGYELHTSAFLVNGLIRVGDPISKIDQLGGIKKYVDASDTHTIYWRPSDRGLDAITSITFYYDSNNVITMIQATVFDM